MIFRLNSQEDTHLAGKIMGEFASPGDLFCLSGPLGAGKTYLTKGIAEGLDIDPRKVTSPTFTLVQEYLGTIPLYHWDLYRLEEPAEALDLGLEDHLYGDGLTVIEWAELLAQDLPKERLSVRLMPKESSRTIEVLASLEYQELYAKLKERFSKCFA